MDCPFDFRQLVTDLGGPTFRRLDPCYRAAIHSLAWAGWKGLEVDDRTRQLLHQVVENLPAVRPISTDPEELAAQAARGGWVSRQRLRRL